MPKDTLIIGVDPAFRNNGFAICVLSANEKTAVFKIFKRGLPDFVQWLLFEAPDKILQDVYFSVENSNIQKGLFGKGRTIARAISVGKNQATSEDTCLILNDFYTEKHVIQYSPKGKGAKIESEKLFTTYSKDYTLLNYKNSQDERDAFKLAYIAKQEVIIRKIK